jgi:hypothetical protein
MRGWRQGLGLLLALVLGALGCAAPNVAPRPPKRPDEIVVPPNAEARFSNPPVYPEPTNFNSDSAQAGRQPNVGAMGPGPGPASMNGMGGMGGMGPMGAMGMGGMGGNGGYNSGGYGR